MILGMVSLGGGEGRWVTGGTMMVGGGDTLAFLPPTNVHHYYHLHHHHLHTSSPTYIIIITQRAKELRRQAKRQKREEAAQAAKKSMEANIVGSPGRVTLRTRVKVNDHMDTEDSDVCGWVGLVWSSMYVGGWWVGGF